MHEFHVDDHPTFLDRLVSTPFGGHLSVRKPPDSKPLICMGQDECIFKQFCMSSKSWTGPDGEKAIVPKDDGAGVMISAFVSQEFGYGMDLDETALHRVNLRRDGKKYSDESAAQKIRGSTKKQPLTQSPFIVEFEYGANAQGYWDYDKMMLQFEDCVDVVQTLHPDYDFIFLFDHSTSGHDRKRPDGLSVPKMTKYFGGGQPNMRSSKIQSQEYLGQFPSQLNVGDVQSMVFVSEDEGPFYLSETEKEAQHHDRPTGVFKRKKRKKADLIQDLTAIGVAAAGNMPHIQQIATMNNIPVEMNVEEIREGWEGKPKGMLQVLWERGFIDPTKSKDAYTLEGKKDEYGNVIPGTSVKILMNSLLDFIEEDTLLQYHGKQLGVQVDRTPKCHPEMAGEGIEYAWGCAKVFYRKLPLSNKRTKAKFRECVKKSLDTKEVLTVKRLRLFSRRARQYILAYKAITSQEENEEQDEGDEQNGGKKISFGLIERIVKTYKTHRSAADFDGGYINGILGSMRSQSCT